LFSLLHPSHFDYEEVTFLHENGDFQSH
jgi:hypothetical protein